MRQYKKGMFGNDDMLRCGHYFLVTIFSIKIKLEPFFLF